ncbi:MAG: arylsulfotransferase family protein [Salibacteraceae bacterium]
MKIKYSILKTVTLVILQCFSFVAIAQNFNRPVPDGFYPYEFSLRDSSFEDYFTTGTLPLQNNGDSDYYISIHDENGYLIWYSTSKTSMIDFKYFPEQNKYSYSTQTFPESKGFKILDADFNLIDSLGGANNLNMDIHDFELLDNGGYLVSARADDLVDLSRDTLNGSLGSDSTYIRGYVIQEMDSQKNLLFEWNSNDFIDPLESYEKDFGYNPADFDYCHGNAIEKDKNGDYLVSMRHTNSIFKVDKISGKIIWRLGGKKSDFSFPNDQGFSGQHDIRELPNGNVTLFDNANTSVDKKSRAVDYQLDTNTWAATKIWEYQYDSGFFARAMGNFQTSSLGFKVVNYGLVYRPFPSFVLLGDADQLIADVYFQDSIAAYRTKIFKPKTPIERTKVECQNNNGTITLIASGGGQYAWSTGETTSQIQINKAGEYQVWTSKGIGMLGSEPIIINDVSTYCMTDGFDKYGVSENKELIQILDMNGNQIETPSVPGIYIKRFSNGSVEKVYLNPIY